ncbi:MAG: Mrp/NBP35 family ATP-binding protein [Oligoflexia bacterium]|nr:Mrp/NBP35 family ATP-binding protein [Oligoflexia bacterium]
MPGIKKVIAVGAGKGGVGKTTVAVNLALSLQKKGLKVGLLDADIYGPSIPHLLGLKEAKPNLTATNKIDPVFKFDIATMSLGFLVSENEAIIWRGPMLFKAISQFLFDVNWGELDYLIVDLPPGTGDVQLTLAQKIPLDGAIIVSTPQDMSLIDVTRCIDMFKKVKVPILGMVENMSALVCENCGHPNHLFPEGNLRNYCEKNNIPLLAKLAFTPLIGFKAETGEPLMAASENNLLKNVQGMFDNLATSLTMVD